MRLKIGAGWKRAFVRFRNGPRENLCRAGQAIAAAKGLEGEGHGASVDKKKKEAGG